MYKYSNEKALSLIELVVVIAIISLTISFGIPLYKTHVNKVNVSQMVNKLGTYKLELIDFYTSTGSWPEAINNATAPATVGDTTFTNATNFRYNKEANKAWWGYQLSSAYGSGWVFMLLIANTDGTYITYCGSLSNSCTYGYCDSLSYYPSGCSDTNLSATYSLTDS